MPEKEVFIMDDLQTFTEEFLKKLDEKQKWIRDILEYKCGSSSAFNHIVETMNKQIMPTFKEIITNLTEMQSSNLKLEATKETQDRVIELYNYAVTQLAQNYVELRTIACSFGELFVESEKELIEARGYVTSLEEELNTTRSQLLKLTKEFKKLKQAPFFVAEFKGIISEMNNKCALKEENMKLKKAIDDYCQQNPDVSFDGSVFVVDENSVESKEALQLRILQLEAEINQLRRKDKIVHPPPDIQTPSIEETRNIEENENEK